MPTKIAVMTDVHANLPALQTALSAIKQEGYDLLVHTGDTIAIGTYPAETVDLLLNTPNILLIMGNHDAWFADGLPEPRPSWMSEREYGHQQWTNAAIDPRLRTEMGQWPYLVEQEIEGVRLTFLHYALAAPGSGFAPIIQHATTEELDGLFEPLTAGVGLAPAREPSHVDIRAGASPTPAVNDSPHLIFYGHHHPFSDLQGHARYINPGSLGCYTKAEARYTLVTLQNGISSIEHRSIPYDDTALFEAFQTRNVPERDFICQTFLGRRKAR
jgi:predicted phosphodiesterase